MDEFIAGTLATLLGLTLAIGLGVFMTDVRVRGITNDCEQAEVFRVGDAIYDCTLRVGARGGN